MMNKDGTFGKLRAHVFVLISQKMCHVTHVGSEVYKPYVRIHQGRKRLMKNPRALKIRGKAT